MQDENGCLHQKARGLDDLLAKARMMSLEGKPEIMIADRYCLLLRDSYDKMIGGINDMAESIEQRKERLFRTITHYEDMIVHIKDSYSPHSTAVLYGIPRLKEKLDYLHQECNRIEQ